MTRFPPRSRALPATRYSLLVTTLVIVAACGAPPPSSEEITVWRPLGKWSGSGLLQTDPFISNTGQLRVTWEARDRASSPNGTLKISLHSDVSGRALAVVLDRRGAGREVAYVNEDPRSFFLVIDAVNLDWSVEVAEGVSAVRRGP